ncbi:MAG: FecR domain-containing protein [Akkermansiaceae bacterium]
MKLPDLEIRIQQLLDDELTGEQFTELETELLENPEAMELYLSYAGLDSDLKHHASYQKKAEQLPVVPVTELLAQQRNRAIRISMLSAAAVLAIVAVVMWIIKAPATPDTLATVRVTPGSNLTLTHSADGKAPIGNVLFEGSRLRLSEGTLEGRFESGVQFVVKAPCELKLLAQDRVFLTRGAAWFSVPKSAIGFTVETPEFEIVDLGTTFGILSKPDGNDEIHVTQGSVEITPGKRDGAKQTLTAGQARRIDHQSELHEIPLNTDLFTTALPETISIPIANHSFEADRNTDPNGLFSSGERQDFGGELNSWTSQSGRAEQIHVGWRGIRSGELDPSPAVSGRKPQALSLITGASVLNVTTTRWSSLNVGDKLTLSILLGMRAEKPSLNWNEKTFFGLTDGGFSPSGTPNTSDTVAHSGLIEDNPATGNQSGDGTFRVVTFSHTVRPADLQRPGMIGILISSSGSGAKDLARNQSFFDHVRLKWTAGSTDTP